MNLFTLNNTSKKSFHAVKAIIYRSDKKLLLQKRDDNPEIPYPLHWNLFGGEVEVGENFNEALRRELIEEIEYSPKLIESEIFQSKWKSIDLHYFPIFISKEDENIEFKLNEGIEYNWFSIDELVHLDIVPAIYENLFKISNYLSKKFKDFNKEYENIVKKNERVYYSKNNIFNISKKHLYFFLFLSQIRNIKVSRICLHKDDDSNLHEMYMFHSCPSSVGPLKQNKESISYHIIDGLLEISTQDENKKIILGSDSFENEALSKSYRLKPNEFRIVESKSDYCIFLEVNNGPFKDNDTIWK
jgi:8-oxo-dGTP diphosphatase